jgi:hypothetical protein
MLTTYIDIRLPTECNLIIVHFQELLEKVEENSSGEEQWDINFR